VRPRLLALLLTGVLLVASACSTDEPASEQLSTPAAAPPGPVAVNASPEATLQPDDLVDLTLYFRVGDGSSAHLEPVVREVPVTDDLPRQALELLLDGPVEDDGSNLSAPLPTTTDVVDFVVEGGAARIELSAAVLSDASSVGVSPANEALALAAVANTLTEFPSIERVELTVNGRDAEQVRSFWGGWGLPAVLIRDESLIGPATSEGEGVADLARFSADDQQVGSTDAGPVALAGLRVRDRLTHTRFTVEVADPTGPDAMAKIPPARVRAAGGEILLILSGVFAPPEVAETLRIDVAPELFSATQVDHDPPTSTLRLTLVPHGEQAFRLHTLSNPTRIVLDVKK
jgi:germination protein M